MNFEQRLQLVYAKGVKYFEEQPVTGATIEDLDLEVVAEYCKKIGYDKGDAEFYLRHNHDFVANRGGDDVVSGAAILLFGKNPQRFFPRTRVRFVRYEGTIVEMLNEYDLVKEFGEGVDRIYRDMAEAGLSEPEYRQSEFMLYDTLKNRNWGKENASWVVTTQDTIQDATQDETRLNLLPFPSWD